MRIGHTSLLHWNTPDMAMAWSGGARRGAAGHGLAGEAWRVLARQGAARFGRQEKAGKSRLFL